MTDPSSITSVTEEDSDESETTETSHNSKTIDSVSSALYSSECNTDDKLSTSLTNVSISKSNNVSPSSKKRLRKYEEQDDDSATTIDQPYPYGSNHFPTDASKQRHGQAKKKQKNYHSTALTRYVLQKQLIHKAPSSCLPKQEEENFGIDDPNNYLYTDFSDTSSIPVHSNNEDLGSDDDEEGNQSKEDIHSNVDRPLLPNLSSSSWFQAKCFDRYWSYYGFVMAWYRQHVEAVNMLSRQYAWPYVNMWPHSKPKKKKKSKRAKSRARHRRLAKAKERAAQEEALNQTATTTQDSDSNADEEELEMEITEDMMDFFTKSYKHRMERDQDKKDSDEDSKAQDGKSKRDWATGFSIPKLGGPQEQPGIRRTAELKTLYGQGAPMIHGMETALQMTYDKVVDRHKPKLWPNMPLKIIFDK